MCGRVNACAEFHMRRPRQRLRLRTHVPSGCPQSRSRSRGAPKHKQLTCPPPSPALLPPPDHLPTRPPLPQTIPTPF
eukprot:124039-Chlamydomonas_euryale.AAC.2